MEKYNFKEWKEIKLPTWKVLNEWENIDLSKPPKWQGLDKNPIDTD